MKKPTVTIGIPALNEEANIKNLLEALISQKQIGFRLEKIIVVSDGSTDKTVSKTKSVKDKRIKVVNRRKRKGMNYTQNQIVKLTNTDVLVLIDADVLPEGRLFLKNIVKPFRGMEKVGIVGADTITLPPRNLIEKAISHSHEIKTDIYRQINSGNNIYMCHGRARAFVKSLYKEIKWPQDSPEDAYSYLFCIVNRYKFVLQKNARVFFRPPATVKDHAKQSNRFYGGQEVLEKQFKAELVKKNLFISRKELIKGGLSFFIKYPESAVIYIILMLYIKIFYRGHYTTSNLYSLSTSSKHLLTN